MFAESESYLQEQSSKVEKLCHGQVSPRYNGGTQGERGMKKTHISQVIQFNCKFWK